MGFMLRVTFNYFIPVLMVPTVALPTSINLDMKIKAYLMDSRVVQKERRMGWVGKKQRETRRLNFVWLTES